MKSVLIPSKIPHNFVQKTLKRLLPDPSIIKTLNRDQLEKLVLKAEEFKHLITNNPVQFFKPNNGGQEAFALDNDPAIRVFCFFAANKTGKTTVGAIRILERLYGGILWGKEFRQPIDYRVPARAAVFAEDFDSHKEITQPALESWAPKGFIKKKIKNAAGQIVEYQLSNGSILHFRSYDQGSPKAEGKDWDIVWCDEPPPRDIYTAIFRGLVATDGKLFITATLLKEVWLYDEAEHPHVKIYESEIHDNEWISTSAKNDFLTSLDEDERLVREKGKPASLTGLIYKSFSESGPYIIPYKTPSVNYPILMGVDPHERKPVYIMWFYITPDDEIIAFDSARVQCDTVGEMFTDIHSYEEKHPNVAKIVIMDPNRGAARQIKATSNAPSSWKEVFEQEGYNVVLGFDDIKIGHSIVSNCLFVKKPRLFFMNNLKGQGGPIWQMRRYSWDDWKGKSSRVKDKKEVPKDLHKDFPDIIRYVCAYDPHYTALVHDFDDFNVFSEQYDSEERAY